MKRRDVMLGFGALAVAGCTSGQQVAQIGPDGLPLPTVYWIRPEDVDSIQFRMEESVNALRQSAGRSPVALDPNLIASAATHARDMAVQNRPWLFGSDGSSPLTRAERAGFQGRLIGEMISESYETELETLAAWMKEPGQRAIILDPAARRMGFAWYQEPAGKLWWTLNIGADPAQGGRQRTTSNPLGQPVFGSQFQG